MLAYKAFDKELRGHGNYQFEIGKTYKEKVAQRVESGFHCAENPLDVFEYFSLNSRFCEVDVRGDIDDGDYKSVVVGTEMTIVRELSLLEMVEAFIEYMLNFPDREWEKTSHCICVKKDVAEIDVKGIAIARGMDPAAKGKIGSILALIQEDEDGEICGYWIEEVDGTNIKEDKYYTLQE